MKFTRLNNAYRLFLADTQLNIEWEYTPKDLLFLDAVNSSIEIEVSELLN